MLECLKRKYEVLTQVIKKAGDKLSFLKRRMVLEPDGRLLIQTHYKHVQQMCSLLGLNKKLQNKKTPGHADMEKDEHTGDLRPTPQLSELALVSSFTLRRTFHIVSML